MGGCDPNPIGRKLLLKPRSFADAQDDKVGAQDDKVGAQDDRGRGGMTEEGAG